MREINYTARFQRDYRREKPGRHSKKLDALLMEVVNLLAADTPLPRRNFSGATGGLPTRRRMPSCPTQAARPE
jgi:mRNA interferase YafQ